MSVQGVSSGTCRSILMRQPVPFSSASQILRGEIARPTDVEDLGSAELCWRLLERRDAEIRRERVREPPGRHCGLAMARIAVGYKNP